MQRRGFLFLVPGALALAHSAHAKPAGQLYFRAESLIPQGDGRYLVASQPELRIRLAPNTERALRYADGHRSRQQIVDRTLGPNLDMAEARELAFDLIHLTRVGILREI